MKIGTPDTLSSTSSLWKLLLVIVLEVINSSSSSSLCNYYYYYYIPCCIKGTLDTLLETQYCWTPNTLVDYFDPLCYFEAWMLKTWKKKSRTPSWWSSIPTMQRLGAMLTYGQMLVAYNQTFITLTTFIICCIEGFNPCSPLGNVSEKFSGLKYQSSPSVAFFWDTLWSNII